MDYDNSFKFFKEILIRHTLFRPPHSIKVFSLDELKSISNFFLNSFYKHYDLYFFILTPNIDVEIRTFEMFDSKFPEGDDLESG